MTTQQALAKAQDLWQQAEAGDLEALEQLAAVLSEQHGWSEQREAAFVTGFVQSNLK